MFNFMALLGWSPEGEQEILTREELISIFDADRLSKSPSMFDKSKLMWVNNRYINALPIQELVNLCQPFLAKAYDLQGIDASWLQELVSIYQEQLSYGAQIVELTKVFFETAVTLQEEEKQFMEEASIPTTLAVFRKQIMENSEFTKESVKQAIKKTQKEAGVKGKMLYMPLRIAVSGSMHGPDLVSTIVLLGNDRVLQRLAQ